MCMQQQKLSNLEAVKLIKNYSIDYTRGVIEFFLDTNSTWQYKDLIQHLRPSFDFGKMFGSLVSDFYSHIQGIKKQIQL